MARRVLHRLRGERGMTVVELLVAMSILGVVMAGVVSLFTSGLRAHVDMDARFQAQVQLSTALGKLRREAHGACAVAAGWTTGKVTLNMPSATPPQPPLTPCSTPSTVTWCTIGSGQRYALYRVAGTTCTATGAKLYADYLTTAAVFPSYAATSTLTGSLARLSVHFPVDVKPADPSEAYTIDDAIVLRNSGS
jgi:prepilin-type N-terminal cleavage/methylation domain-containing protein